MPASLRSSPNYVPSSQRVSSLDSRKASPVHDSHDGPGNYVISNPGFIIVPIAFRRWGSGQWDGTNGTYSLVSLPGNAVKARPRRRYDEIEHLYQSSWPNCTKAYGTLNHLDAHVTIGKRGSKRSPMSLTTRRLDEIALLGQNLKSCGSNGVKKKKKKKKEAEAAQLACESIRRRSSTWEDTTTYERPQRSRHASSLPHEPEYVIRPRNPLVNERALCGRTTFPSRPT